MYYYFHLLEELFPMACSSTSERSGRREASCTATVLRAFYVVLRILFALLWYWASFFLREKRKFLVYFIFVEHIAYLSEGKGRWEINYKKYLSGSTSCDFHKIAFFFSKFLKLLTHILTSHVIDSLYGHRKFLSIIF